LVKQLGETEKAADYFHQGLELASGEHCTAFTVPANDRFHPPPHLGNGGEKEA
jgi:hypothetical protein